MSNDEVAKQEAKSSIRNYTRTANVLFDAYPDLHPQEKWLYINLVYLCGARGTRYLSIRYMAQRTGISAGALSGSKDPEKNNPGMVRNLHNAGLIHAEKKKARNQDGSTKGQEQYHITITDIWQLNEDFFIKRSHSEHSNNESVQNVNASVQEMNASSRERSENERERSEFDTNIRLHSKITDSSKITREEDTYVADATSDSTSTFFVHPLFSFLSFDDLVTPSVMRIELIPFNDPEHPEEMYRYWSDIEEKRRTRTAWEVEQNLKAKGVQVRVEKTYKTLTWNETVESDLSTPTSQLSPANVENPTPSPSDKTTDIETSEQKSPIAAATKKGATPKPAKPEMPLEDAPWPSEETAVQIIEAKKGRRYGDTTRAQEKTEAKKVLKLYYGDEMITRQQFEQAVDDMCSWSFWKEHTNVKPMIKTLRKDDKILNILDDLEKKDKRLNGHPAKTDRVYTKNTNRATQSYTPEDYEFVGDVERRQREEFLAAKQMGA